MADETATTGNDDLLRRCIDVFLNASPMVLGGEKVPGYVTVHVTEEFRDEIVNAQLDSGSKSDQP